ncbi:MAG: hypothetical protein Q4G68_14890, partial [Planctomycetia bacterium]|nr:hypothetical protein [Planctomycetia bacterium]
WVGPCEQALPYRPVRAAHIATLPFVVALCCPYRAWFIRTSLTRGTSKYVVFLLTPGYDVLALQAAAEWQ